jgi:dTDP-4-dehydrorhamnose reductase
MRVLVLGATGMLGHRLVAELRARFAVSATVRGEPPAGAPFLTGANLVGGVAAEDFETVVRAVGAVRPEAVVNCIGIVKQLAAAKDPIPSITVNALFPHRLARLCRAAGARLIHLSTDCVFSGTKGVPYTEDDPPDPPDLYGRTKLLGEVAGPGSLTLRTSMIGRELRNRAGLVEWFLGNRGGSVRGFASALYTGLTTPVLARLLADLLEFHPPLDGLYHVAAEAISKYALLQLIDGAFGTETSIERDTSFVCDRRLDGRRFTECTGFRAPSWPEMVRELARDRAAYEQLNRGDR